MPISRIISFFVLFFVLSLHTVQAYSLDSTAYGSTPISQSDKYPHPQNRISLMTYLIFNQNEFNFYKSYLAKELDYVWFDQTSLLGTVNGRPSFDSLFNAFRELRQLNPSIKIGSHGGGAGYLASYHLPFSYLSDADFLHNNAGSIIHPVFNDQPTTIYLNTGNAITRQKLADSWKVILDANPALTGITLDYLRSYHTDPPLGRGCREGACNTRTYWISSLTALGSLINQTVPADRDITYNGLLLDMDPNIGVGTHNEEFLPYFDGLLSEFAHVMLFSPSNFDRHLAVLQSIVSSGKKVWFYVQPQIITRLNPSFTYTNDVDLQRFFLATYLLFQKKPLTYFGYHPGLIYHASGGVYFYADWNKDYGNPVGGYTKLNSGLYVRQYDKGIAVVNPTVNAVYYTFPVPGNYSRWEMGNLTASPTTAYIGPRSGSYFFRSSTVSASPPASTAPSKPGDLNGDGFVNLYDYTLLVSRFGNPYTIYDYSILLSNLGL